MASTKTGRRLTEQHRRAQISLRARFLRQFAPLYQLLEWTRLDATAPAWARVASDLVKDLRQESANLAAEYFDRYRVVEAANSPIPTPVLEFSSSTGVEEALNAVVTTARRPATEERGHVDLGSPKPTNRRTVTVNGHVYTKDENGLVKPRIDWSEFDKAVEKSLLITGPGELKKRASRGESEAVAKRAGLVAAGNSATRQVLRGGREAITTLVQADEVALGWARVTDGDPCAFCAMLASRGPVYKSAAQAGFKAHDACACSAEPTYSRAADWPGDARRYQQLWREATKGYSGQDAINAFRRHYEKQRGAN